MCAFSKLTDSIFTVTPPLTHHVHGDHAHPDASVRFCPTYRPWGGESQVIQMSLSAEPGMRAAQEVYEQVLKRQHHRFVGESLLGAGAGRSKAEWKQITTDGILKAMQSEQPAAAGGSSPALTVEDIWVDVVKINCESAAVVRGSAALCHLPDAYRSLHWGVSF